MRKVYILCTIAPDNQTWIEGVFSSLKAAKKLKSLFEEEDKKSNFDDLIYTIREYNLNESKSFQELKGCQK